MQNEDHDQKEIIMKNKHWNEKLNENLGLLESKLQRRETEDFKNAYKERFSYGGSKGGTFRERKCARRETGTTQEILG